MFFSYLEHIDDLEGRQVEIINQISKYFVTANADKYFIMDPYFDAVTSLQEPFRNRKLESTNWSFLLAELASKNSEFQIFTNMSIDGLTKMEKDPPYEIISGGLLIDTKIYVCKYRRNSYNGFEIHDRYILQENSAGIKGLHIGPSLDDIHNKDVSLTKYSKAGAEKALKSFKLLWEECVKTKGWKKG